MNPSSSDQQLQQRVSAMAFVLEALSLTRGHEDFSRSATALCDLAASQFGAQVSLGWVRGHYVKLRAVSGMATPEKGTEMAENHEKAMEETLGAAREICLDGTEPQSGAELFSRNHRRLALATASESLLSVPVTLSLPGAGRSRPGLASCLSPADPPVIEPVGSQGEQQIVGLLMLSRARGHFLDHEILAARLLGMNLGAILEPLYQRERWFGARMARWLGQRLSPIALFESPLRALGLVGGAALALWLCLGTLEYQVSAPFMIRARREALVPALRDGFVTGVLVQTGDRVSQGQALVTMDTLDLEIQRQECQAEIQRFREECSKALSENRLGDMEIASARQRQSQARLEAVNYQIRESTLVSPLGAVVLDDMKMSTRIGAPLSRGLEVMRLGAIDDLLAELRVREWDFHYLKQGQSVRLQFLGQPGQDFGFQVESISPAASQDQEGAYFLLNARPQGEAKQWWRPGMTGMGRIAAGTRSPLWIATHRLIDWLALRMWFMSRHESPSGLKQ